MRIFRKNRISDEQVKEILRSLPHVQAPADFEDRVGRAIEAQRLEVPHILGSLPLVPAADDFDAKLMKAIQERRRPADPIATPVSGAMMRAGWINSAAGWVGGALMIMALAFFVDRSGVMSQDVLVPPAQRPVSLTQPVVVTKPAPSEEAAPATAPVVPPISIIPSDPVTGHMAPVKAADGEVPSVTVPKAEAIPAQIRKPEIPSQTEEPLRVEEEMSVGRPAQPHQPRAAAVEETSRPSAGTTVPAVVSDPEIGAAEKTAPTTDSVQGIVDTGGKRDAGEGKKP